MDSSTAEVGSRLVVDPMRCPGKRALDVALVFATAPVWLPLLAASAAVTFVTASRPVFFSQTRMGQGGRPFRIHKIRTMRTDVAAPASGLFAGWTYGGDPRITPVGGRLRRYRLDELPQMWNILRGEMSWVGPRPEPWEVALALGEQIPSYHERHRVLPGLTGLCQISPLYHDFGTIRKSARKARLDRAYVRRWSLGLDLRILVRTAGVLWRGSGVV